MVATKIMNSAATVPSQAGRSAARVSARKNMTNFFGEQFVTHSPLCPSFASLQSPKVITPTGIPRISPVFLAHSPLKNPTGTTEQVQSFTAASTSLKNKKSLRLVAQSATAVAEGELLHFLFISIIHLPHTIFQTSYSN